jgi:hypothetical protein
MLFKVTKEYIKGVRKGEETSFTMKFTSIKKAEEWAVFTSIEPKNLFIITEVIPTSKYEEYK